MTAKPWFAANARALRALAVALCLVAPSLGPAHAAGGKQQFEAGVKAYESGDYVAAFKAWLPLAYDRDPAAQRNLGHLYRMGLGVTQDFAKAAEWYGRAAKLGLVRAQANLGNMFLRGQGVGKDFKQAHKWFERAATQGHVISQYNLGLMYESGMGVASDDAEAVKYFYLASKGGHDKALSKLALMIASHTPPEMAQRLLRGKTRIAEEKPPAGQPTGARKRGSAANSADGGAPRLRRQDAQRNEGHRRQHRGASRPQDERDDAAQPATASQATARARSRHRSQPRRRGRPAKGRGAAPLKLARAPGAAAVTTPAARAPAQTTTADQSGPEAGTAAGDAPSSTRREPPVAEARGAAAEPALIAPQQPRPKAKKGFFAALFSVTDANEGMDEEPGDGRMAALQLEYASRKSEAVEPTADAATQPAVTVQVASAARRQADSATDRISPPSGAAAPAAPSTAAPGERTIAVGVVMVPVSAILDAGLMAYRARDYRTAMANWLPLAEDGNTFAQFFIGGLYADGSGVPRDPVRAMVWWTLAGKQGHPNASQFRDTLKLEMAPEQIVAASLLAKSWEDNN